MRINLSTTGFGLIELMVSISIMLLVMTVIITRQDSFNGATLLRGEAYKIALLVRETQALAVSAAFADDTEYRSVLGVYFTTIPGGDHSYPIFKDDDGDFFYDESEKYGRQGLLDNRFEIDAIRLIRDSGAPLTPNEISIVFERPNFDAKIYEDENDEAAPNVSGVEIDVRVRGTDPGETGPGALRTIEITKTGQISVKNVP